MNASSRNRRLTLTADTRPGAGTPTKRRGTYSRRAGDKRDWFDVQVYVVGGCALIMAGCLIGALILEVLS